MSNKTISQFNTDGLLTGSEYLLGMSEGVTVKLVLDSVKNFILSGSSSGNTFVESISDDGNGIVSVDNSDPLNPIIVFSGVTTDGSTITGTGLVGDPLVATANFDIFVTGGTYSNGTLDLVNSANNIVTVTGFYTGGTFVEGVTDDGNGSVIVNNTDPLNPVIEFTGVTADNLTITGTGLAGSPLAVISSPLVLVNDYIDDAAADADTNLPSGGLYTTSGSTGRTVYRKP